MELFNILLTVLIFLETEQLTAHPLQKSIMHFKRKPMSDLQKILGYEYKPQKENGINFVYNYKDDQENPIPNSDSSTHNWIMKKPIKRIKNGVQTNTKQTPKINRILIRPISQRNNTRHFYGMKKKANNLNKIFFQPSRNERFHISDQANLINDKKLETLKTKTIRAHFNKLRNGATIVAILFIAFSLISLISAILFHFCKNIQNMMVFRNSTKYGDPLKSKSTSCTQADSGDLQVFTDEKAPVAKRSILCQPTVVPVSNKSILLQTKNQHVKFATPLLQPNEEDIAEDAPLLCLQPDTAFPKVQIIEDNSKPPSTFTSMKELKQVQDEVNAKEILNNKDEDFPKNLTKQKINIDLPEKTHQNTDTRHGNDKLISEFLNSPTSGAVPNIIANRFKDGLAAKCPYDWKYFQDHCYLAVSGYPESARSWYNAEDYCRSKNATLTSILSSSEEDFVSKLVKPIMFTDDIWIGLHSLTKTGKFQWSDGSVLDYQIWDSNRLSSNKCVALRKDNGQWKDKNCGYLRGFVCKKPSGNNILVPPPIDIYVPTGNCPVTWYKYGQKCYKYFGDSIDERISWKEAKQACESLGENHFLVSIHSEHEQMFLTSMQAYHDYDTWIGLERSYTSKLEMWSDNSRFNYTNWIPGAGGYYWVTRCAKLRSSKKSAGKWDPVSCDEKLGYICQRDPDPVFEPHPEETKNDCQGFTNYRNACYRLVKQRRSWSQAEKDCQQHQGHLVSINDELEYAFLYNFVREVKEELWIGLRIEKGSKMYSWSDGWPNLFLAWENRPKEASRPQCAYMNNSTRFWNVENCEVNLPYVCKITTEKRPVIPIAKYTGKCPSYWENALDFGGKYCYHIGNISTVSWGQALAYCMKQDSKLASFHSIYETELLWPLIGNNNLKLWLGLYKRIDGKFVWQDGSEVDFTNWFPSPRREGDCVYMATIDMKWVQQACNNGYNYARPLCMKEKDRS